MTIEKADEFVKQSKDWRKRMDDILQEMKERQAKERAAGASEHARHLSLSITHLEDAIMRQGMRMKAINEAAPGSAPDPYPTSYDPTTSKVEPTSGGIKL
jgi:hypothetical protein